MKFDYLKTIAATPEPCTPEAFAALIDSPRVAQLAALVLKGDKEAKRRLPAVTWQASFGGQGRKNKYAQPSGLYMLDVDHVPAERMAPLVETARAHAAECGIMVVHTTPSGAGLRVVARMLAKNGFATIGEHQHWLAARLGLDKFDDVTHDWARLSFVVPRTYIHFLADDLFTAAPEFVPPVDAPGTARKDEAEAVAAAARRGTDEALAADRDVQTAYQGIPLADIANRYFELQGDPPAVGERNSRLYAAARDLRYVTDFRPEPLARMLPDFGLSRAEVEGLARSACDSAARRTQVPDAVTAAVESLRQEQAEAEEQAHDLRSADYYAAHLPPLPHVLSKIIGACPADYRTSTLLSLLPVLGTLATGVRGRYLDGTLHSPSFFTCVEAPQASGKSFVRHIVTRLLQPIAESDRAQRLLEEAYKADLRKAKNAKVQPVDPGAVIRIVPASISVAALLKRLDAARGRHLFTFAEELDTLTKSNKSGAWAQKSDIYRTAFDNAEYGQDYLSENSYSAIVRVFYNLLVLGTPRAVGRFFNDPENGLVSRVIFARIPSQFGARMPQWRVMGPATMAEVDALAARLMATEGELQVQYLNRRLETWLEERRVLALALGDISIDIFRRRAAVIGFRAGLLAHAMMPGERHCKRLAQAMAVYVANYVLAAQVERFGNALDNEPAEAGDAPRKFIRIYEQLPERFTRTELEVKLRRNGFKTPPKVLLSGWKRDGMVTPDPSHRHAYVKGAMPDAPETDADMRPKRAKTRPQHAETRPKSAETTAADAETGAADAPQPAETAAETAPEAAETAPATAETAPERPETTTKKKGKEA